MQYEVAWTQLARSVRAISKNFATGPVTSRSQWASNILSNAVDEEPKCHLFNTVRCNQINSILVQWTCNHYMSICISAHVQLKQEIFRKTVFFILRAFCASTDLKNLNQTMKRDVGNQFVCESEIALRFKLKLCARRKVEAYVTVWWRIMQHAKGGTWWREPGKT